MFNTQIVGHARVAASWSNNDWHFETRRMRATQILYPIREIEILSLADPEPSQNKVQLIHCV